MPPFCRRLVYGGVQDYFAVRVGNQKVIEMLKDMCSRGKIGDGQRGAVLIFDINIISAIGNDKISGRL